MKRSALFILGTSAALLMLSSVTVARGFVPSSGVPTTNAPPAYKPEALSVQSVSLKLTEQSLFAVASVEQELNADRSDNLYSDFASEAVVNRSEDVGFSASLDGPIRSYILKNESLNSGPGQAKLTYARAGNSKAYR